MKNKWKGIYAGLAAVLVVSMLAGCSGTGKTGGNHSNDANNGNSEPTKLNIVDGKIEPEVTITMARGEDPTATFKNGESYADNVHTRWAKEELGINLQTLWSSPSADTSYDTRLKLMLSSGDKFPDVFVSTQPNTTNLFIDSGKLLDVGEAFEKYASDTWKAAMAAEPSAWHPFMKDGKKYALPVLRETLGTQSAMWIRQDWLDQLEMKAPTTIEELEALMDAFVNLDPDQNGVKDTIALDFAMKEGFTGNPIGDSSWLFGMFGAIPERWYPGEDGALQYGSTQPGIKTALTKLNEWKNKGYIPNDIALHDFNKVVENVTSGKVGILGGEHWLMVYPGAMLLATNPNAMYVPYPLPAGLDGQNMRTISNPYTSALLISKDISEEALQAFFYYQNKLYEAYSSEDPLMYQGYQDGYDYVVVDGEVVMDESEIPGGKAATMKYTITGAQTIHPVEGRAAMLKRARGEELTNKDRAAFASSGVLVVDDSNPLEKISDQATLVISTQTDADVREYFQGPATKTMLARNELLKKLQMDTYTEIIYGKKSPDTFDQFVEKWKTSGGDDIIKEVNEWYDTVK